MKTYCISAVLGLMCLLEVSSLEIRLLHDMGKPDVIPMTRSRSGMEFPPGFANLAWLSNEELVYHRSPFAWRVGANVRFERDDFVPPETATDDVFTIIASLQGSNGVALRYGTSAFDARSTYYLHSKHVSIDIDTFRSITSKPFRDDIPERSVMEDHMRWAHELYGGYRITPGFNRFHEDEWDVLLNAPNGQLITALPAGIHRFYNIGNHTNVAVTHDRFTIAMVATTFYRTPESRREGGWYLFILGVTYDATPTRTIDVLTEPHDDAERVGFVAPGRTVTVTDAENYGRDDEGRWDYWYYVEDANGWVFGADLLIEGETWQDRLVTRGNSLEDPIPLNMYERLTGMPPRLPEVVGE